MFPEERRTRILEILSSQGRCRVAPLAEMLAVSEVTIRQDLDTLEKLGLLKRTYGGAMLNLKTGLERAFELEQSTFSAEKKRIGLMASELVSAGDTIILDVGTTVAEVARQLQGAEDLTVITNALNIALLLEDNPHTNVLVTGGTLRAKQHSLVNPYASLLLEKIHADYAFIGVSGIDATYGVTNVNIAEAEMKAAFMKAARTRVLVADSSKIGNVALAKVGEIIDFDLLITDDQGEPSDISRIREQGLEVRIA